MDQIARRAAVNKQLLFYYFHSKRGLFTAVFAPGAAPRGQALVDLPARRRRAGPTGALEGGRGAAGAGRSGSALGRQPSVDPVRRLHQKRIVRVQVEEVAEVSAHGPRALHL